jgi:GDP/UDP-N,N'-diacetylbacillosamine 2-epimerase (hydrolysing)
MSLKQTICVVTSTRAEYGLLYWLMKSIRESNSLKLDLAVTGSHLSADHGNTYKFIESDGFRIDKKISILKSSGVKGVGKSSGVAISKFTEYFSELKPSAVLLLGDRYEILAIAQAAIITSIPLIHLHGGEITEGANDDLFRNAITKLSSYHFTSNIQHRNRVIQMGEQLSCVKVSGALGIENIRKLKLITKKELEKKYSIKFKKNIFLITFHPATLENKSPEKQFKELLNALVSFGETTFVISKANADNGGEKINEMIDQFSKQNSSSLVSASFGQINYLSLMKIADVVIGNSSSGIIEAPSLETPTVNIGTRQKGRMSAKSVIHCNDTEKEIITAILNAKKLKSKTAFKNPYDHGNSSEKIVRVLEKLEFNKLFPKKFYDLNQ